MTKKDFIKKIQVIGKDDLFYSVVYVLKGCRGAEPAVTICLYFSLADAMDKKEYYQSLGWYDVVYIIEEMVW